MCVCFYFSLFLVKLETVLNTVGLVARGVAGGWFVLMLSRVLLLLLLLSGCLGQMEIIPRSKIIAKMVIKYCLVYFNGSRW